MSNKQIGNSLIPVESNGAMPVNIQDQHSLALDLKFIQAQGIPNTLAVQANPGDTTITLTDATGYVANNITGLFSNTGQFFFAKQLGAPSGNILSLDTPVDKIFLVGSSVIRALDNMAVDGSGTTQIFQIGPVGAATGIEVDITRVVGYIQDGAAMDDALFGALAALPKGIVFRHNNGIINTFWNAKTNGELALICASDFNYTNKAPAGSFGARFRNTYAGPEKHGVTIRLEAGDTLEMLIQDNLTGLELFNMMAQGHVVTD